MKRAFLALLFVVGCSKTQEPDRNQIAQTTSSPPAAAASASTTQAAPAAGHEVVWDAPASWEKGTNTSPMRKATYRIPKAAGDTEDTELTVTVAGGSSSANVDRWVGQFAAGATVDKKERTVGSVKVTVVEIKGTFSGGGGMGAPGMAAQPASKEHFTMLGAIATGGGEDSTFFKMVGPDKTVKAARPDFDKLVDSLKTH
jgi:hypothetical protein